MTTLQNGRRVCVPGATASPTVYRGTMGTIISVSTERAQQIPVSQRKQGKPPGRTSPPGRVQSKRRDGRFKLDQSPREDGLWLSLGAN
jgi:hypothetical protein